MASLEPRVATIDRLELLLKNALACGFGLLPVSGCLWVPSRNEGPGDFTHDSSGKDNPHWNLA